MADIVALIERDLQALEQHIPLIVGIGYMEVERLRAWLDRLHEQIEVKLVEAPDYPDRDEE